MDVVYVTRDGANPELRYSLRTLRNVEHRGVWVFGGGDQELNLDNVWFKSRRNGVSAYSSTRAHITAACNTPEVSDPFMLWNDDFYAMRRIYDMPVYHRGPLERLLESSVQHKTTWWKGLRATAAMMEKHGMLDGAFSYDTHLPLIVHKKEMREALRLAERVTADAVHVRTLYGAICGLGGVVYPDPKMIRRSDPFPTGPWLSSSDNTFRSSVEPVLRYLFPDPSPYESE